MTIDLESLDRAYTEAAMGPVALCDCKKKIDLTRINNAIERMLIESEVRKAAYDNVMIGLGLEVYAKTGQVMPARITR